MHHTFRRAAALGVVLSAVGALAATGMAGAATSTHSGALTFSSVAENNGKPLDIVTGVIVDHGTDKSVGEKYQEVILSKGTFEVYSAQFNKSFKIKLDRKACTAAGTAVGKNLALSHGTGAYAGITGSISITASFVDLGVVKNGKCENLNTKTAASLDAFSGIGHASY